MAIDLRSDNVAPVAREIMAAIAEANHGPAAAYGADDWTGLLQERFSLLFETPVTVLPTLTGTAANALSLSLMAPPFGAVYCAQGAHVDLAECGAGEFFTGGAKLVPLEAEHGRLSPEALERALAGAGRGDSHRVQPAALSLTQATERGTVYPLDRLRSLTAIARREGLRVHMDGARLANAVATLGCSPADATWRAGIDVLSFGATKNGAMCADAVVVFDPALAGELRYRAQRAGQILSKMRFLSCQLLAAVADGLWLRLARDANRAARRLADGLAGIDGVEIVHPVEINQVFARLPGAMRERLERGGVVLYPPAGGVTRLVTAFDTASADIDRVLAEAAP
jgi:threonine aldolase